MCVTTAFEGQETRWCPPKIDKWKHVESRPHPQCIVEEVWLCDTATRNKQCAECCKNSETEQRVNTQMASRPFLLLLVVICRTAFTNSVFKWNQIHVFKDPVGAQGYGSGGLEPSTLFGWKLNLHEQCNVLCICKCVCVRVRVCVRLCVYDVLFLMKVEIDVFLWIENTGSKSWLRN